MPGWAVRRARAGARTTPAHPVGRGAEPEPALRRPGARTAYVRRFALAGDAEVLRRAVAVSGAGSAAEASASDVVHTATAGAVASAGAPVEVGAGRTRVRRTRVRLARVRLARVRGGKAGVGRARVRGGGTRVGCARVGCARVGCARVGRARVRRGCACIHSCIGGGRNALPDHGAHLSGFAVEVFRAVATAAAEATVEAFTTFRVEVAFLPGAADPTDSDEQHGEEEAGREWGLAHLMCERSHLASLHQGRLQAKRCPSYSLRRLAYASIPSGLRASIRGPSRWATSELSPLPYAISNPSGLTLPHPETAAAIAAWSPGVP